MRIKIFNYIRKSLTLRVFIPIFLCLLLIFAIGIPYVFSIIGNMRNNHASQVVLDQNHLVRSKIINTIQTEFTRSIRFAESELTIRWSKYPKDPYLTELFFEDAKNFYINNKSEQMFIALLESNKYYFNSNETKYTIEPRYVLSRDKPKDQWFYTLLDNEKLEYKINIDHDWVLDRTNVWFNVVIKDKDGRYGLTGAGIPLESFVSNLIQTDIPGLSLIILDKSLNILAHPLNSINLQNAKAEALEEKIDLLDLIQLESSISEISNEIVTSPNKVLSITGINSNGKLKLAFSYIPELNWIICSQIELSQLELIEAFGVEFFFVIILLSIFIFYLLLTLLVNKMIIIPINRIEKEVRAAIDMDYSGEIIVKGQDELANLSILFNDLIKQVRSHTQNLNDLLDKRTTKLLKTQDQVFQQQYAESLGKLVIALSHQFNTPLGVALTSTTAIEDKTNDLKCIVNDKHISIKIMNKYSGSILELTRLAINNLKKVTQIIKILGQLKLNKHDVVSEFTLFNFFNDILNSYKLNIESLNVEIEIDISKKIKISTFKNSLSEVIDILIDNSLNYAFVNQQNPKISITSYLTKMNRVFISISDNGSGILPSLLPDIFDPFTLSRLSKFGFGIGLFKGKLIVKSILKGNFNIESSSEIGTIITIELPNLTF